MMSLPIDNIGTMFRSHANDGDVKLTVEEVENVLLENQECLEILFFDIQTITALFREDRSIMPVQCREAIKSLDKVQLRTLQLHSLLDKPDYLPIIFTALRYRIIFQIHLIEKQSQQLISFIESYRAICAGTTDSLQRRKQICQALEMLLETTSDISEQINFIRHEAQFHQRRLVTHMNSLKAGDIAEESDSNEKHILCLQAQQE